MRHAQLRPECDIQTPSRSSSDLLAEEFANEVCCEGTGLLTLWLVQVWNFRAYPQQGLSPNQNFVSRDPTGTLSMLADAIGYPRWVGLSEELGSASVSSAAASSAAVATRC